MDKTYEQVNSFKYLGYKLPYLQITIEQWVLSKRSFKPNLVQEHIAFKTKQ